MVTYYDTFLTDIYTILLITVCNYNILILMIIGMVWPWRHKWSLLQPLPNNNIMNIWIIVTLIQSLTKIPAYAQHISSHCYKLSLFYLSFFKWCGGPTKPTSQEMCTNENASKSCCHLLYIRKPEYVMLYSITIILFKICKKNKVTDIDFM